MLILSTGKFGWLGFDLEILVKKFIMDEIPEIDVGESIFDWLSFRVCGLLIYDLLLGGDFGCEILRKLMGKLAFLMLKSFLSSNIGYLCLSL